MIMAGNDGRSNCWAFLLWTDSMPDYSFRFLKALNLPVFISPLHDRDTWTYEDSVDNYLDTGYALVVGQAKKPHYHIMIHFESNKSASYVLSALSPLHIQHVEQLGVCERSKGMGWRGYARYLCHLDNPEKAQYDPAEVVSFGGRSYFRDAAISAPAARAWDCAPIFEFISLNGVTSYSWLLEYCRMHHPDWYPTVFINSTKFVQFLKSMDWSGHKSVSMGQLPAPCDITTHSQGEGNKSSSLKLIGGVLN